MLLAPCLSCRRHARIGERCPFCGGEIDASPPAPIRLPLRLAAIASLALGCSSGDLYGAPSPPEPDTGAPDTGYVDTGLGDTGTPFDTAVSDDSSADGD